MSVKERNGDWLKVQVPVRPNETTGWIKSSTVDVRSVPNHIVVEVSKRRLSAFSGSTLLMEAPVGVGKPRTPTPTGNFYVDISLKNPGGAYGRHMLSVAGFSNVLKSFGNGVGQVAIHGTNNPGSVGQFSSNGCMRLNNDTVEQLATLAPTGTPVFVLP
jgi:lipoprotein-anchoring transpeptidase ErfK/SrfK